MTLVVAAVAFGESGLWCLGCCVSLALLTDHLYSDQLESTTAGALCEIRIFLWLAVDATQLSIKLVQAEILKLRAMSAVQFAAELRARRLERAKSLVSPTCQNELLEKQRRANELEPTFKTLICATAPTRRLPLAVGTGTRTTKRAPKTNH